MNSQNSKTVTTIVDTQAGNLFSLKAALERIGRQVIIAQTPQQVVGEQLVIPGQGRFGAVMRHLEKNNWIECLTQFKQNNKAILGICVGMQIFFESSGEDPGTQGLGWLKGSAEKLNFPKQPMVGWAPLTTKKLPEGTPYFVNSFAVKESEQCIAQASYGETFCAAVKLNSVTGFQFHPEKSSQYGLQLLSLILNK